MTFPVWRPAPVDEYCTETVHVALTLSTPPSPQVEPRTANGPSVVAPRKRTGMLPTFETTTSAAADFRPTCTGPKSNPLTWMRASSGVGGVVTVGGGAIGVPPSRTITAPPPAVVGVPGLAVAAGAVVGHTRVAPRLMHGLTVTVGCVGGVVGGIVGGTVMHILKRQPEVCTRMAEVATGRARAAVVAPDVQRSAARPRTTLHTMTVVRARSPEPRSLTTAVRLIRRGYDDTNWTASTGSGTPILPGVSVAAREPTRHRHRHERPAFSSCAPRRHDHGRAPHPYAAQLTVPGSSRVRRCCDGRCRS